VTPAGYSGKPLATKLGFKPGMRVYFADAPAHYRRLLGPLPADTDVRNRLTGRFDLIHLFTTKPAHLQKQLARLRPKLAADGMLWVSWPKKTSKLAAEIAESDVRGIVLAEGDQLVDVKICAVDEDWSGLKFVIRKAAR
jgi:hypothetical protein